VTDARPAIAPPPDAPPTGVIDVGTNTVRMLVAERRNGVPRILDESGEVTSLGLSLVRSGRIDDADADRTVAFLAEAVARARSSVGPALEVVGTEVFRRATNGRRVAERLAARIGAPVRILTPIEEAEASYLGAVAWRGPAEPGPVAVVDIGGGSTEFILGDGLRRERSASLPVGALVVTERWLSADPPGPAALAAARESLVTELAPLATLAGGADRHELGRFLAVGGSACSVAAWTGRVRPYVASAVHGRAIDRAALAAAIDEMAGMSIADRAARGGFGAGRARVILGGAVVLDGVLATLGLDAVIASTFGLRHGVLLRRWDHRL
jgi:exopolyphosphatase/guanosine-5'-triphosphate,3'-diphosphate pyrophosphatase